MNQSGSKIKLYICLFSTLFLITACGSPTEQQSADKTDENPVENLIRQADEAYKYEVVEELERVGYTLYLLRMTSQEWLDESKVENPEWWHWLMVVVPEEVKRDTSLLWIGGGSRMDNAPDSVPHHLVEAAMITGSVTAEIYNVPNQPVRFAGEDNTYREDELIAYGWRKFLESGAQDESAEWLARVPMTRAAIRAMDTITDFAATVTDAAPARFVISGESKRGWTTWTTAIFDERVVAIAPAVIDLLNLGPSFQHHWRSLGEWSPAITDYYSEGIMQWKYSQEFERLTELVDPYSYLDRLNIPKYIINAGSDEFFVPDSWKYYWPDLEGEKYLRYLPNTGHDISGTDAMESLISFYQSIIEGRQLPELEWEIEGNIIHLRTDPDNSPDELNLWHAANSSDRDFRLYVIYQTWDYDPIAIREDGVYEISIPEPQYGYTVNFIEAVYDVEKLPFKQTTGTLVLPERYLYDPFEPDEQRGTMSPDGWRP